MLAQHSKAREVEWMWWAVRRLTRGIDKFGTVNRSAAS